MDGRNIYSLFLLERNPNKVTSQPLESCLPTILGVYGRPCHIIS